MSRLTQELERYLAVRRGLGFDLTTDERILRRFVAFADEHHAGAVTTDAFLRWKAAFGTAGRETWAARLGTVRIFAQWLKGIDPRTDVPPRGLIPNRYRRVRPHIFRDDDLARILTAAEQLPSVLGLRGRTYATLFGLIAVTGLRVSEALALDDGDVDWGHGVITVRRGKAGSHRHVVVSADTLDRLKDYARERDRLLGSAPASLFADEGGRRPTDCGARYNFARIGQQLGLRPDQRFRRHGRGPRIHDLRHTFAVRTILRWYRDGRDPSREMFKLSTYLGHANPNHTYWYLEAVPELLELARDRAARGINAGGSP